MILLLDSSTLIYRFEGTPAIQAAAAAHIAELAQGAPSATLAVSRLSLLECRVKPLREGDGGLLARYDAWFATVSRIVELDAAVVGAATLLRARHGLKTPDALVAACALSLPSPRVLVSGDAGFQRVPGLQASCITLPTGA
ncbi:PIN domain-containing protein [Ramlibacter sp. H39-3-26]|uniref:type II toxin-antitoxin system VapC family toxin n=1 Tax=Curvibacter soli TaxID=3031331 RepID=UPI0023DBF6E3|nr:PIN domain-containing protein [Ramlibacter sp. H39-3-26]MDF1486433.1 PIN domain-containing protein [Ramlibacter sp. H39-3-26]